MITVFWLFDFSVLYGLGHIEGETHQLIGLLTSLVLSHCILLHAFISV